jgi:hypothetical protein
MQVCSTTRGRLSDERLNPHKLPRLTLRSFLLVREKDINGKVPLFRLCFPSFLSDEGISMPGTNCLSFYNETTLIWKLKSFNFTNVLQFKLHHLEGFSLFYLFRPWLLAILGD